jgi:hypothetical protein
MNQLYMRLYLELKGKYKMNGESYKFPEIEYSELRVGKVKRKLLMNRVLIEGGKYSHQYNNKEYSGRVYGMPLLSLKQRGNELRYEIENYEEMDKRMKARMRIVLTEEGMSKYEKYVNK